MLFPLLAEGHAIASIAVEVMALNFICISNCCATADTSRTS